MTGWTNDPTRVNGRLVSTLSAWLAESGWKERNAFILGSTLDLLTAKNKYLGTGIEGLDLELELGLGASNAFRLTDDKRNEQRAICHFGCPAPMMLANDSRVPPTTCLILCCYQLRTC